jgi:hypothetical protein
MVTARRIAAGVACLLVLGIGSVVWFGRGTDRGIGDQGGRVLDRMEATRYAVPAGATNVGRHATDAVWGPACVSIAGSHAGWIQAQSFVSFTDPDPSDAVVTSIGAVLQRAGWVRHDEATGPGQGKLPHWTLRFHHQPPVTAFAFQAPAHSGHWMISSAWQPAGPIDQGCP